MKITILDKEVELKSSFRAYIIFENITGKSFQSLSTMADVLVFMYASILASLKSTDISFNDFMDYIDEHPETVTEFSQWMVNANTIVAEASNSNVDVDDKNAKKKKTTKR